MKAVKQRVGTIILAMLMLPAGAAIAEADQQKAPIPAPIQEFAERLQDSHQVTINPTDYEIRRDHTGTQLILRRDVPAGSVSVTKTSVASKSGKGKATKVEVTVGPVDVPSSGELDQQATAGSLTADGITWSSPFCFARLEDDRGWMDACWQHGTITYQDGRANVYKRYATCSPLDDSWFTELDECYVETDPTPESTFRWHDWSPKSTVELGGCGNVSLSIGVGGVSASMNVATCEKLVPEKGEEAGKFKARWIGDAYWDDDVREVGSLIAISGIGRQMFKWGFISSECNPPPDLIDECG